MKNVYLKKFMYPYKKIEIPKSQACDIGVGLQKIYEYIGRNKNNGNGNNMSETKTQGNAYRSIRMRAKKISGRADLIFSKKEVKSLISYESSKISDMYYVKIPYKMDLYFQAIFQLVDEIKKDFPLPHDLEIYLNRVKRDCFFDIQSENYSIWYKKSKKDAKHEQLNDDMFSGNATISQKF